MTKKPSYDDQLREAQAEARITAREQAQKDGFLPAEMLELGFTAERDDQTEVDGRRSIFREVTGECFGRYDALEVLEIKDWIIS